MNRAFTQGEYTQFVVDTGSDELQGAGKRLLAALEKQKDLVYAIGVLHVALTWGYLGLLHKESPMPEDTIQQIYKLIDAMKHHVEEHEDCHRNATKNLKEAATGEPADDPPQRVH